MADLLMQYGLFLAKVLTVVVALGALAAIVIGLARRTRPPDQIQVRHMNEKYENMSRTIMRAVMPKKMFRRELKERKKELKRTPHPSRRRLFVLDFHGDIRASAIASLREEVTAVLTLAGTDDEVVLRLENAGGLVHGHGLAASQLMRIRHRGIPLTVAVDKIAASGGYLMASVANRVLAAPFAIIGSIGVLAQVPNFHRLLDSHGIDFEQVKAGPYKRSVTLFGPVTEDDRARLREEVEETHRLFKEFVAGNREALDVERVATGEHWYGARAVELGLVDDLVTSDDYLLRASEDADLYEVTYTARKPFADRLSAALTRAADRRLAAPGVAGAVAGSEPAVSHLSFSGGGESAAGTL